MVQENDDFNAETDRFVVETRILKLEYGEPRPHDVDLTDSVKKRSCTDVCCCIVFFLCIIGAGICSLIGYARGNPERLVHPTNSAGHFCGQGELQDKPYLFFFDLLQCAKIGPNVVFGCPTVQVCLAECPKENFVYLESVADETLDRVSARKKLICVDGVDPVSSPESIRDLVRNEKCAAYYVESMPIIDRCIPSVFDKIADLLDAVRSADRQYNLTTAVDETVTGEGLEKGLLFLAHFYRLKGYAYLMFNDLTQSWPHITVWLLLAMVLCFVWVVLLRFLVAVMVWVTIVLFAILFTFSSVYSYIRYQDLKLKNVTDEFGLSEAFVLNFEHYLSLKTTWLIFCCISGTILVLFLLIVLILVKRICIAVELIAEASKAISKVSLVLLWPLVPFLLQLTVISYWIFSALHIGSMGKKEFYTRNSTENMNEIHSLFTRVPCTPDNTTLGKLCDYVKYGGTRYAGAMQIYMLFMFFWLMNFVVALGQMTLAGVFASYYWALNKDKDIPFLPVLSSLARCLRYHIGSIAFGALVISVVQLIRSFLEYLSRRFKTCENDVAKFCLKCLKCCFWCVENVLKFINKNAYIMIAVYGQNFCSASKNAFQLIMRNVLRTVVLDKVSDFILFINQLMVTSGVAVGAYFWFQHRIPAFEEYVPDLNFHLFAVMILVVGTYLVSSCFFSVYDMAVDTLFLCFLEDLERNDGSAERPYFMNSNLRRLLGKGVR